MAKHDWMRQDKVNILDYLPDFLQSDEYFKATNDTGSREHDTIRLDLQDLLDQCYVDTSTWGLTTWEDLVGLPVQNGTKNYAKRRAAVKAKLQATYSVTLAFIQKLVDKYTVANTAEAVDVPSDYRVDIYIQDGRVLSWADLDKSLRMWLPAHIGWRYIARGTASVGFYTAVAVSTSDSITIEPQSDYEVSDTETSSGCSIAVSVADYQHIDANIYD